MASLRPHVIAHPCSRGQWAASPPDRSPSVRLAPDAYTAGDCIFHPVPATTGRHLHAVSEDPWRALLAATTDVFSLYLRLSVATPRRDAIIGVRPSPLICRATKQAWCRIGQPLASPFRGGGPQGRRGRVSSFPAGPPIPSRHLNGSRDADADHGVPTAPRHCTSVQPRAAGGESSGSLALGPAGAGRLYGR